jgi:hypothetical protein
MSNAEFGNIGVPDQGSQGEPESIPSQMSGQGGEPQVFSNSATVQPQGEVLVSQPSVGQDQNVETQTPQPEVDKEAVETFKILIEPYVKESLAHSSVGVEQTSELSNNISTAKFLLELAKTNRVQGQEGLLHGGSELLEPVLRESFREEATRKLEVAFAMKLFASGSQKLRNIRNLVKGVSESEGSPVNKEDYNTIVSNFASRVKLNFRNAIEEAKKGKQTETLRKSGDFVLLAEQAFGAGFANELRRSYEEAFGRPVVEYPNTVKEEVLGDNPKPLFVLQE